MGAQYLVRAAEGTFEWVDGSGWGRMSKMVAESFSDESEEWEGTKGDRTQITKTGVAGKVASQEVS